MRSEAISTHFTVSLHPAGANSPRSITHLGLTETLTRHPLSTDHGPGLAGSSMEFIGHSLGYNYLNRHLLRVPVREAGVSFSSFGISRFSSYRTEPPLLYSETPKQRHGQAQPGWLAGIDVARVVKKLAVRVGLDAAKYAGHSLGAGHATSAAVAGASERSIMNQTGHRSVQMVRRYIRDGGLFRENSMGKSGL